MSLAYIAGVLRCRAIAVWAAGSRATTTNVNSGLTEWLNLARTDKRLNAERFTCIKEKERA